MRYAVLLAGAIGMSLLPGVGQVEAAPRAVSKSAPKTAAAAQPDIAPTQVYSFDDCYRLAWVRGVHVEQNELEAFDVQCMAGQVPFETGNPADSIRPSRK